LLKVFDRAIDLLITRLRRKIELDPTHPIAIRTVRGVCVVCLLDLPNECQKKARSNLRA
jgi:two-component system OmpR family response regulator